METRTCRKAWEIMTEDTRDHSIRNYTQELDMSDYLVETDMFPREVLEAYTAKNLEKEVSEDQKKFFNNQRGGGQGDYREGMTKKIANVVDCLTLRPQSKRAVITISNNPSPSHTSDDDAKCMRELHLHIDEEGKLSGTVLFRAQAAIIFPKNIHYVGSLMEEVASKLPSKPALGKLFYLATILVSDRA